MLIYTDEKLYATDSWLKKPIKTVRDIMPLFEGYKKLRVLDLGCGVGRNSIYVAECFKDRDCVVDCVDLLEIAIEKLQEHATEIHFLEKDFRKKFLEEMSLVAVAAYKAFQPDKLNYELLGVGNGVHMHWHFFPRRAGDTPNPGPVWQLGGQEMNHEKYLPTDVELEELKRKLNTELDKLL